MGIMVAIKFTFFAYGILAIAALALLLSFVSDSIGKSGSAYFGLAVVIVLVFFLYLFLKMFKGRY